MIVTFWAWRSQDRTSVFWPACRTSAVQTMSRIRAYFFMCSFLARVGPAASNRMILLDLGSQIRESAPTSAYAVRF